MSLLLFALQTAFDTIWINYTEEQIEQVHIVCLNVGRSAWLGQVGQDVMYSVQSVAY